MAMKKVKPNHDWNEIFVYDESIPSCLRWKHTRCSKAIKGKPAGRVNEGGYYRVTYDWDDYLCHGIVWEMHNSRIPDGYDVDHRDRTKSNVISNLRLATRSQNLTNSKLSSGNKSGFRGVFFDKQNKKWFAYIRVNKKMINLGRYETKEEAAFVRDCYAVKHHGEFAVLNFPNKEG